MIKRRNIILWDGGSGYKIYVFKEFIRRCAINCKGQGRKEVIYLRVADVSCTRGVHELPQQAQTKELIPLFICR